MLFDLVMVIVRVKLLQFDLLIVVVIVTTSPFAAHDEIVSSSNHALRYALLIRNFTVIAFSDTIYCLFLLS